MNDKILEELQKCKKAIIPVIQEDDVEIIIPRSGNTVNDLVELTPGFNYIIELEGYITNPPETFTLAENWNQGRIPSSRYLYCSPKKFAGNMTLFDSVGYDMESKSYKQDVYIDLWLPRKGFKIISKE